MKEITLELTNRCLNNCLHCSTNTNKIGKQKLDINYIKSLLLTYKPEWVNLSGGEPLLYPKLFELIEWLKEYKFKIKFYTCGNISNPKIFQNIKVDKVIFSFHTYYKKLFEFITQQNNSYSTTLISLYETQKNNDVEVHIVPMSITMDSLDRTIEFLNANGVNKISFLKLINQGRCKDNEFLLPKDYKEIFRLKEKYPDLIRLGSPFDLSIPCTAGSNKLVVMSNGNIIPCESFKDGSNKCERITY